MSRTTQRERETYRDFADKSGGDSSDIIHDLCHDADRLAQAEALLRDVRHYIDYVNGGHGNDETQRIDAFLSNGGE